MITKKLVNSLNYQIIGCAIEVHKYLGPGLLESVYHQCMIDELLRNKLQVNSNVVVPLHYKGRIISEG